jgi:hypothetical protein
MSRDSGGILLRGVFAISNWHAKPSSSVMPRRKNQRHSRTPIVVVVSFPTAFYRLIYTSAVTIWIAHRTISAFSIKLKRPD